MELVGTETDRLNIEIFMGLSNHYNSLECFSTINWEINSKYSVCKHFIILKSEMILNHLHNVNWEIVSKFTACKNIYIP